MSSSHVTYPLSVNTLSGNHEDQLPEKTCQQNEVQRLANSQHTVCNC